MATDDPSARPQYRVSPQRKLADLILTKDTDRLLRDLVEEQHRADRCGHGTDVWGRRTSDQRADVSSAPVRVFEQPARPARWAG